MPHDELAKNTGEILKEQRVALYRDPAGKLHAISAVCTHMGCVVGWNDKDKTWDCPCHGSRFAPDGVVIHGPAAKPLPRAEIPE